MGAPPKGQRGRFTSPPGSPRLSFRTAHDPRLATRTGHRNKEEQMAELTSEELASVGEAFLALVRKVLPLASQPIAGKVPREIETIYVPNQGEWTRDMVARLKETLSYPAAVVLLDMAAERPDEEIKFTEVVARSGLPARQVAAELGAMSKLSRKLFDGRKIWPLRWWQDATDNITRYVMHRRVAEWWRSA